MCLCLLGWGKHRYIMYKDPTCLCRYVCMYVYAYYAGMYYVLESQGCLYQAGHLNGLKVISGSRWKQKQRVPELTRDWNGGGASSPQEELRLLTTNGNLNFPLEKITKNGEKRWTERWG